MHPVDVLDPSEADAFRSRYEAVAALLGGSPKAVQMIQVHRFYHWAWELCTHSAVLDAVESLLGARHPALVRFRVCQDSPGPGLRHDASGRHLLGTCRRGSHHGMDRADCQYQGKRLHAAASGIAPLRHSAPCGHVRRRQSLDPRTTGPGGIRRIRSRRPSTASGADVAAPCASDTRIACQHI